MGSKEMEMEMLICLCRISVSPQVMRVMSSDISQHRFFTDFSSLVLGAIASGLRH